MCARVAPRSACHAPRLVPAYAHLRANASPSERAAAARAHSSPRCAAVAQAGGSRSLRAARSDDAASSARSGAAQGGGRGACPLLRRGCIRQAESDARSAPAARVGLRPRAPWPTTATQPHPPRFTLLAAEWAECLATRGARRTRALYLQTLFQQVCMTLQRALSCSSVSPD